MTDPRADEHQPKERSRPGSAPPRRSTRPNVILEDLDSIEAQRMRKRGRKYGLRDLFAKAGPDDPRVYRRLSSFARPYYGSLLVSFLLAGVAALATLGQAFVLAALFDPLSGVTRGDSALLASLRSVQPVLRHRGWGAAIDAVGASVLMLVGHLRTVWEAYPPREQLGIISISVIVLVLIENANSYVQRLIMRTVSLELVRQVRAALFDRMLTLSMRFYQANHSGKLLSRLTNDLSNLGALLVDVMVDFSTDALTLLGVLVALYVKGGVVVLLGMGIVVVAFVPVQQISRRIGARRSATRPRWARSTRGSRRRWARRRSSRSSAPSSTSATASRTSTRPTPRAASGPPSCARASSRWSRSSAPSASRCSSGTRARR